METNVTAWEPGEFSAVEQQAPADMPFRDCMIGHHKMYARQPYWTRVKTGFVTRVQTCCATHLTEE